MQSGVDLEQDEAPRRRLAVKLTKDAQRQIRGGHPWVFDDSIVSIKPGGVVGDLAVIFDDDRKFMAIGLYDPSSPIRIKVLHHGKPRTIDETFWQERIVDAIAKRRSLIDSSATTAYRLVSGENDRMAGLVLDQYDTTLVLKLYSAAWIPHLPVLVPILESLIEPSALIVRMSRNVAADGDVDLADGTALIGDVPGSPVRFLENDLVFDADVVHGQKTGHFLDQRDNRLEVRSRASGARMLDMFSCTGGFTVNAAAGGARSVHSVDVSPHAIEACREHMAANALISSVANCDHKVTRGDAFATMEEMIRRGERFDLVVVDPPSFASSQRQVGAAVRSYERLAELAVGLIEPGGTLVSCSCSSRVTGQEFFDAVHRGARRGRAQLSNESHSGHPIDHPIGFAQGAYLDALFARVEPVSPQR
jgi:23S rRNA (cytosine1962-C5)-methyltransferase